MPRQPDFFGCEQASLIVTSNKPFGRWGVVFGDDGVAAAAVIDLLVHHAEVASLKGIDQQSRGSFSNAAKGSRFSRC